jgi:Rod binding domain-containing protein
MDAAPSRTLELRRGEAAPQARVKLERLAAGFEAVFTSTLLGELLKPLQGAGLAGDGPGASVVQGLIETHLAEHVAKAGGLGIGRMVVKSLEPLLEARKVTVEELASRWTEATQHALAPAAAARALAPAIAGPALAPAHPGWEDVR